jgi:large subunit ribosomal protein L9
MKIILREHVEHLGDRGDEVNVAAGYARNYLLPKGLAYTAGAGAAKQIADQQRTWAKKEAGHENAANALAAQVGALELTVRRRAGEGGTLYGSVTNGDVAEMLASAGHDIPRRKILVKEPIKSLGDFEVTVKLHRSVSATVKLSVVTEAGQTLAELEALRKELEPAPPQKSEFDIDEDGPDDEVADAPSGPAAKDEGQAEQES